MEVPVFPPSDVGRAGGVVPAIQGGGGVVGQERPGRVHRESGRGEEGGIVHPVDRHRDLVEGEEQYRVHEHVYD